MNKIIFTTLLGLTPFAAAFAALPPLAQSSREIQAILVDPRLQEMLGSAELIQSITRTEEGYVVITSNYQLRVDVEYKSSQRIGPVSFDLQFYEPVAVQRGQL
ncbi:MAG: hypothetical protein JSS32_02515 [Verrucomicrobia bacterium]|nr:hypothetical protein [Verrucomicrobiota bacterium]